MEDLPPEQQEESVPQNDGDVDLPDSSCDENFDDEIDVSKLVEEYTKEWVNGLNRDDMMSINRFTPSSGGKTPVEED